MATLRAIRKRIASIRNTGQITRAMKMVAAAKLRRAQERISAARPFSDKMQQVLSSLAARTPPERHPLLQVREASKVEVVILTSDRGLCGAYNMNVIRQAEAFIKEQSRSLRQVGLTLIGKKGRDYFYRRGYKISRDYLGSAALPVYGNAALIGRELVAAYQEAGRDRVYLVYSRFVSAMTQRPQVVQLLPVEPARVELGAYLPEYFFEPSEAALLDMLLPRYVEVQIFRALLEAAASEHAARMRAMDNATKNTEDMVQRLTLELNKARQAAITKELLDIVTGAEAQKRS